MTEERRLVEEEGSLSKNTWSRRSQEEFQTAPESSCKGPGAVFSAHQHIFYSLRGRAWRGALGGAPF